MRLHKRRYKPAIIRHCLAVYGRSTAAQQDSQQPTPADSTAPSTSLTSSSGSYRLDERSLCLHFARKLFKQRALWPLYEFLPAWQDAVPGGMWCPQEEMLAGEALVQQPDPSEGLCWAWVVWFGWGCLYVK